jgi:acyl-CoA thioesterase FadM
VFFHDRCVATAECVNVCFDTTARASVPLSGPMRRDLLAQMDD